MSEQPGHAAGTAEPNEPPTNFNKPWILGRNASGSGLIMDRDGSNLAYVLSFIAGAERSSMEIIAISKHIVACVNFCQDLDSEFLEAMGGGDYKITLTRVPPLEALAPELAANSAQFHADQAGKPAAALPGGVL